jgi:hypothetical protein
VYSSCFIRQIWVMASPYPGKAWSVMAATDWMSYSVP